jgi:hypothetical protein
MSLWRLCWAADPNRLPRLRIQIIKGGTYPGTEFEDMIKRRDGHPDWGVLTHEGGEGLEGAER